jgi:23S rRNA (adenine2503-C2)-methyltransferase
MHVQRIDSSDTNVSKYVYDFGNAVAESVLYKYPTYEERTVMCVSTQSGCPVGCRFCGAGDNFVRSLGADEICEQVVYMLADRFIDPETIKRWQIMFMSMGEPMLNWASLKETLLRLGDIFPRAALLISTTGPLVPKAFEELRGLSQDIPTIGLQFSVHETTNDKRDVLIPFKNKMTLRQIADEGERWAEATGRQPFFNYCAHDKNSADGDADMLETYFSPEVWQATISVVCERDEHVAAANARQRELAQSFMAKLTARGYSTRCFDPAGQDDIGGGCGQLWFVQDWMSRNPHLARPSVGRGLPIVHTPRE